jgi:hypothetical protein
MSENISQKLLDNECSLAEIRQYIHHVNYLIRASAFIALINKVASIDNQAVLDELTDELIEAASEPGNMQMKTAGNLRVADHAIAGLFALGTQKAIHRATRIIHALSSEERQVLAWFLASQPSAQPHKQIWGVENR